MQKIGTLYFLHRDQSKREVQLIPLPLIVSVLCSGQNIRRFSETTGPTEAKFQVAPQ